MKTARRSIALLLPLLLLGCDLPKDPAGTTDRILSEHLMRVGVGENPPWVRFDGDDVQGIEPALIRGFAASLGARIEWVRGAESRLLEALERRGLDVVCAGIPDSSPWTARLARTEVYYKATAVVAVPRGTPAPQTLQGLHVVVDRGDPAAAELRNRGAIPVTADAAGNDAPRLVYRWQARRQSLNVTRFELATERHILLSAPGENGLLLRLDRYLHGRKPVEPGALMQRPTP